MSVASPHAPRLLCLDTSTERLHVGLSDGSRSWTRDALGGASASATTLAVVMAVLNEAGLGLRDLDAIGFGAGPGSFTGLRTACAVAQGLAFGVGLPVVAVPTMLAVATDAHLRLGLHKLCVVMDARMGEVYADFVDFDDEFDSNKVNENAGLIAISPEKLSVPEGYILVGNFQHPSWPHAHQAASPSGQALLVVAAQRLHTATAPELARPVYVRDKVARTEAERALDKAKALNP